MRPLVGNAADREQVKTAGRKERRLRKQEVQDIRKILSLVEGRRFIWRYLEHCGVFKSSFSTNGSMTSFLEGQRGVGLKLIGEVTESEPQSLITMMTENRKDEEKDGGYHDNDTESGGDNDADAVTGG